MDKTIFIGSRKGGVGKTMTAASLGRRTRQIRQENTYNRHGFSGRHIIDDGRPQAKLHKRHYHVN